MDQQQEYLCFHLAFPIGDLAQAKEFYVAGLGCTLGRETKGALILGLGGHQLVGHLTQPLPPPQPGIYPRHFGLIFAQFEAWERLYHRAIEHRLPIRQPAKRRFAGEVTDHYSFFVADPFGNLLEFKHYVYPEAILGAQQFDRIGDPS
jgi:uncharacterized protein